MVGPYKGGNLLTYLKAGAILEADAEDLRISELRGLALAVLMPRQTALFYFSGGRLLTL